MCACILIHAFLHGVNQNIMMVKIMNTNVFKMSALALCLGAGAVNTAHAANAYAYHETNLLDGFITVTSGTIALTQGNNTSQAGASLSGLPGVSDSVVGAGLSNVAQQAVGNVTVGADHFAPQGVDLTSNYSRGDSAVIQEQATPVANPGTGIFVSSVSETNVNGNSSGAASATTSSAAVLFDLDVQAGGGTLNFKLPIDVVQRVALSADAVFPGSKAESILQASIQITDSLTGAVIFEWAPDGSLIGGISGGAEVSDPFSLNSTLTALLPGTDIPLVPASSGIFEANTAFIAAGSYVLSLSLGGEDSVAVGSVPESGSLAMLGLGLVSLAGVSARRRKKSA